MNNFICIPGQLHAGVGKSKSWYNTKNLFVFVGFHVFLQSDFTKMYHLWPELAVWTSSYPAHLLTDSSSIQTTLTALGTI